jgi:hypothetical protein
MPNVLQMVTRTPFNSLPSLTMTTFGKLFRTKKCEKAGLVIWSELICEMKGAVDARCKACVVLQSDVSVAFFLYIVILAVCFGFSRVPNVHAGDVKWFVFAQHYYDLL